MRVGNAVETRSYSYQEILRFFHPMVSFVAHNAHFVQEQSVVVANAHTNMFATHLAALLSWSRPCVERSIYAAAIAEAELEVSLRAISLSWASYCCYACLLVAVSLASCCCYGFLPAATFI